MKTHPVQIDYDRILHIVTQVLVVVIELLL